MGEEAEIKLNIEEEVVEETPEYNEIEQEAIAHGWNPEGVEGKRNLTAEEFMDRKPLYDDLHSQQRKIKRLEEGMEALKQHNKLIAAKEREKVINELKRAKKLALQEEDFDAVIAIDDKIAETRTEKDADEEKHNYVFETWVENNSWYSQDPEMKEYADMIGHAYYNRNPTKTVEEVYAYVEKETKTRFADKFHSNTSRSKPAPVEGAATGRRGGKGRTTKYSVSDLPPEHVDIMKALIRSKVFDNEQDYLKEYFG